MSEPTGAGGPRRFSQGARVLYIRASTGRFILQPATVILSKAKGRVVIQRDGYVSPTWTTERHLMDLDPHGRPVPPSSKATAPDATTKEMPPTSDDALAAAPPAVALMPLKLIKVRDRHRRELGDVEALAASMGSVGLLHPIIVNSQRCLVAGERRLAAARILGWDAVPVTVADSLDDALPALLAERDENMQRKDFAPTEAVALARALEPMERAAAKARQGTRTDLVPGKLPEGSKGDARDKLAQAVGLSGRTLEMATAVVAAAEAEPEVYGPIVEQMDQSGNVSRAYRQTKRTKKAKELQHAVSLPAAKYRVVYADPPWSYNDKADEGAVQAGGAEKHYPSMSIKELCDLPVPTLIESKAVLFLWVTSPLIFEAQAVLQAWGFTYKAMFVWDKVKHNMGHYNSVRHELLLICTRGSCTPDVVQLFDSVQSIERTTHSTKPEEFRHIIDTLYPHGKRIELFARGPVPSGWDAWGFESTQVGTGDAA